MKALPGSSKVGDEGGKKWKIVLFLRGMWRQFLPLANDANSDWIQLLFSTMAMYLAPSLSMSPFIALSLLLLILLRMEVFSRVHATL